MLSRQTRLGGECTSQNLLTLSSVEDDVMGEQLQLTWEAEVDRGVRHQAKDTRTPYWSARWASGWVAGVIGRAFHSDNRRGRVS